MRKLLFWALAILMGASACKKQDVKDAEIIQKYIADNQLNAIEGPEGMYYVVTQEGTGGSPTINNNVTVHYEGFLVNGNKFDSSRDRGNPATFPLVNLIRGWQLGIPLMKTGGKAKLILPSKLAYGSQSPSAQIPPNSVLIFDIELISFQ